MPEPSIPQAERLTIEFAGDTPIYPHEGGRWCRWEEHEAALKAERERALTELRDREIAPELLKLIEEQVRKQVLAEVDAFKSVLAAHLINLAPVDERFSLNEVEDAFDKMLSSLSEDDQPVAEEVCSGCGAPRHGDHDNACPTGKWKVEAVDCGRTRAEGWRVAGDWVGPVQKSHSSAKAELEAVENLYSDVYLERVEPSDSGTGKKPVAEEVPTDA